MSSSTSKVSTSAPEDASSATTFPEYVICDAGTTSFSAFLEELKRLSKEEGFNRLAVKLANNDGETNPPGPLVASGTFFLGGQYRGPEWEPVAEKLVDLLDNTIKANLREDTTATKRDAIHTLASLCFTWDKLPSSWILEEEFQVTDGERQVKGDFHLWKGTLGGREVQVGTIDISGHPVEEKKQWFKRLFHWKYSKHNNLLPLHGIITVEHGTKNEGFRLEKGTYIVSPWMRDRGILTFIGNDPTFNRFELLLGVYDGLMYMHSEGLVHDGLNSIDVLVDDKNKARLDVFLHLPQQLHDESNDSGAGLANVYAALGVIISQVLNDGTDNAKHPIMQLVKRCENGEPDSTWPELGEFRRVLEESAESWEREFHNPSFYSDEPSK